jgi:PEP-CTERM motif
MEAAMRNLIWGMVFGFTSMAMPLTDASAQTAVSRTIPVTFTGVVANNVTNDIRIRQSDGTYAQYTGPVPDYPYRQGDTVSFSFNAVVPTRAAYDAGGPLANAASADGIYRITVSNPFYSGGGAGGGIGNATNSDVSGPINPIDTFGQPTNTRMTLVYDYIADSYSIDFSNGGLVTGAYSTPSYLFDAQSGALTPCAGFACGERPLNATATFFGTATEISGRNIGINGTAPGNGPTSGSRTGLFDLIFSGSWNLPSYNGGGPIDVPEPATTFFFAAGAAAVMRRRRKVKVA